MKGSIKKALSLLLTIALLASLVIVPAAAAEKTGAVGDKWDFSNFKDTTTYPSTYSGNYDGLTLYNVGAHENGYANFNANGTIQVPVAGACTVAVQCQYGADGTVGDKALVRDDSGVNVATYSYTSTSAGTVTIARTSGNVYVRYIEIRELVTDPTIVADEEVITKAGVAATMDVGLENADGKTVTWEYTVGDDTGVVTDVTSTEAGKVSFTPAKAGKTTITLKATVDGTDYTQAVTVYVQPATMGEVEATTYDFTGDSGKEVYLTNDAITLPSNKYNGTQHGVEVNSATIKLTVPAGKKANLTLTTCTFNSGASLASSSGTVGTGASVTVGSETCPVYTVTGAAGETTITVTGKIYLHSLAVELLDESAASVAVSPASVSMRAGESADVTVTASGYADTMKPFAVSGDENIATVAVKDNTVTVTGKAEGATNVYVVMADAQPTLAEAEANTEAKVVAVTVSAALPEGTKEWDFKVGSADELAAAMTGLIVDKGTAANEPRYHGSTYGIYFFPGNYIAIPVDGPADVTVSTGYTWDVGLGATVNTTLYGTSTAASGDNGKDVAQTFRYTGGKGFAYVTAGPACTSYLAAIKVEPLDIEANSVTVWDFGAEALDESLFVNKLTVDVINGLYPAERNYETGSANEGYTIPSFTVGDLTFNDGGYSSSHRLRTDNEEITRYGSQTKLGAVGADPYAATEVTLNADGSVKAGEFYHGLLYSNKSGDVGVNMVLAAKTGDKLTYIVSSNGNAADYALTDAEGETVGTDTYPGTVGDVNAVPMTFYAPADGNYAIAVTNAEKLVVCRIYQESGTTVTVSGTVDASTATGIPSGYKLVFTGPGGVETTAAVGSDGSYTAELKNYLSGAEYTVTLEGADGYIVADGETLTLEMTDRAAEHNVVVSAVELVTVTGKVTGLSEADLANLVLTVNKPEDKIFTPKIVPAADGSYTASFEKGVAYTLTADNVLDYELTTASVSYTVDTAADVAFAAKPTYAVTVTPDPDTVDLSAATITFSNLDDVDDAHPDGYVYTFTGTDGIALRDGQYVVKVTGVSAIQKLTPDLKVNGAVIDCPVPFLAETPTEWDFSDETWTSQTGAVESYNGLTLSGVSVNKTYALTSKGGTIQIPVTEAGSIVTATFCYSGTGTLGDVAFAADTCAGSTSKTESVSYTVKDADVTAGFVTLTAAETAGTTDTKGPVIYLTKIEVISVIPYAEKIQVGADKTYKTVNEALAAVRAMERTDTDGTVKRVTIEIDPGNYQEMLRIDTPNVTLTNASAAPSLELTNKGVDIDANAVRITSYYGHGYAYYSMDTDCTYNAELLAVNKQNGRLSFENPGTGTTSGSYWNATAQVMASGVEAKGIIFENSFNQYQSELAANDVIIPLSGAKEGSVARAEMKAGDTTVQQKEYVERAAALAIRNNCTEIYFENCKFVGRQDTLYGGTGVTAGFKDCVVMGGTDYIFGGMNAVFAQCELMFNTNDQTEKGQKDDVGYITAPQQGTNARGYLFYNCLVTSTTPGVDTASVAVSKPGAFGRPWAANTGEAVFYKTYIEATDPAYFGDAVTSYSLIQPAGWLSSLSGESALCGDYETTDYYTGATTAPADRAAWSAKFTQAQTADGAAFDYATWMSGYNPFGTLTDKAWFTQVDPTDASAMKTELTEAIAAAEAVYAVSPDAVADGTAASAVARGEQFVTESDKAAFASAIAEAKAVLADENAAAADVLAATKAVAAATTAFQKAIATGSKAPDTAALSAAIAAAEAKLAGVVTSSGPESAVTKGTQYATTAEMNAITAAIADAKTVLNSASASQADVDAATKAIADATAAFSPKTGTKDDSGTDEPGTDEPGTDEVDKTALSEALTAAKSVYAIDDDVEIMEAGTKPAAVTKGTQFVTQDVYDALGQAIAAAEAVLADENATAEDVAAALAALTAAEDAFAVQTGTYSSSSSSSGTTSRGSGSSSSTTTTTKTNTTGGTTTKTVSSSATTYAVKDASGETIATVTIPATIPSVGYKFIDVPDDHWAAASINNIAGLGMVKGVDDVNHIYDMTSATTRGAVATILYRVSNGAGGLDNAFSDVAADAWYADGVAWAAKAGVVNGVSADTFAPDDPVTREQLALMLYRYAGLLTLDAAKTGDVTAFTDAAAIDDWAAEAMTWAVGAGILQGDETKALNPTGYATRAETACMLDRFVALMK